MCVYNFWYMTHTATKIVIITEKLITRDVTKVIEECGASGYTVLSVSGKGSRGVRSGDQSSIVDNYSNVKIEIITTSLETAEKIANTVADEFFEDYAGITYLEEVQILRPHKFV